MKGANRTPAETPAGREKVNFHPIHSLRPSLLLGGRYLPIYPSLSASVGACVGACVDARDEKLRDLTARSVPLAKIIAHVVSFFPTIIRFFFSGEGGGGLALSLSISTAKRTFAGSALIRDFTFVRTTRLHVARLEMIHAGKEKKKEKKGGRERERKRIASFAIGRA